MKKNIELTMRIRNAALLDAITKQRTELQMTIAQWCEIIGISPAYYQALVSFRRSPLTSNGDIKEKVKLICSTLDMDFADLFDVELYDELDTNRLVTFVSPTQLRSICDSRQLDALSSSSNHKALVSRIEEALETLSPRDEKVLRMRFGIDEEERTLKEIGEEFGCSGERIGQIERKALKRLRHPSVSKELRPFHEEEV
jgi:RNA polymerase sigma factor (sigma-70 family)